MSELRFSKEQTDIRQAINSQLYGGPNPLPQEPPCMATRAKRKILELREVIEQTMWHEKEGAQIEVLEWLLEGD